MLLEVDCAGAEWVCVAYLTQDPIMLDVVKAKKSPHVVTGARMANISEDLVARENALLKKATSPEEIADLRKEKLPEIFDSKFLPRTQSIREAAKRVNHSCNYDIGYKEFALKNEISEKEGKQRLELYHEAYPGIHKWHEATREKLRKTRTLENCFGRKCYFMGQINDDMFKQGYAFVPQSTVADVTRESQTKWMAEEDDDFSNSKLLAQVHDSLLFDYLGMDFQAMARFCVKQFMQNMRPVLHYNEDFRLDVTLKVGMTWGTMKEVDISENVDKLAVELESKYRSFVK